MKRFLFIIALCALNSLHANETASDISADICACLSQKKSVTQKELEACTRNIYREYEAWIKSECLRLYSDTSKISMYEFGAALGGVIYVNMANNCDPYFHFMEAQRNAAMFVANKDSVKTALEISITQDSTEKAPETLRLKAYLYIQLEDYNKAIPHLDKYMDVLQEGDKEGKEHSLFLKAWALEKKGHYKEALSLYNTLAEITGSPRFKVYAAIVSRKLKG